MQLVDEPSKNMLVIAGENYIINVDKKVGNTLFAFEDKQRCVSPTTHKAIGDQKSTKAMKPGPRSLLETIKGFIQTTYMIGATRILKT